MKAQGVDRHMLPWMSPLQPYSAWFGVIFCAIIVLFSGFSVFLSGGWNVSSFFSDYVSEYQEALSDSDRERWSCVGLELMGMQVWSSSSSPS